jgi:RNA polymerase sigma-70 factor (ECF subfamily)
MTTTSTVLESTDETIDGLFRRVINDDYAAFEKIFRSSYRYLCIYSSQLVVCPQTAEEIVDDVFCNLWNNRKKIRISSSFRAYLITSIRNRSLDSLRKLKGVRVHVLEQAHTIECKQSIAYESLIYDELASQIDGAVQRLPEQCRLIFKMSREQDLSYKDIALKLNISVKTVDTQIGRALKAIRRSLADHN